MPRAKSPERLRMEQMAVEQGVSYEAIRKAHERRVKLEERLPPVPELYARRLPQAAVDAARETMAAFDAILVHLKVAQSTLGRAGTEVHLDRRKLLKETLQEAYQLFAAKRPACVCPYCKQLFEGCLGCFGTGWVSTEALKEVPADLLSTELPVVLYEGRKLPCSAFPEWEGEHQAVPPETTPAPPPEPEDELPIEVEYDGEFDPRDGMDPDDIGPGPGPEANPGSIWDDL